MKAGRNDPCPCGSGKKYKKCCLGKDLEASLKEAAAIPPPSSHPKPIGPTATARAAEPPPPPPPPDPIAERADSLWQEFETQDGDARIAVFRAALEDTEAMSDDLAFEMLGVLHRDAVAGGDRARFAECVDILQERRPDVFEKSGQYYVSWCLQDALAEGRREVVPSVARELAARAGRDIDIFSRATEVLGYHGELNTLVEALRIAWPLVKSSDNVVSWGITGFAATGFNHEIYHYLEHTDSPDPDDPALLDRVRFFVEEPREGYLREFIGDLTGNDEREWRAEDLALRPPPKRRRDDWDDEPEGGRPPDPGAIHLGRLIGTFVGYLRREEGVPYPRGELVREELFSYLLRRNEGKLDPRPSMLETALGPGRKLPKPPRPAHPLCPERVTLDGHLAGIMGMFSGQYHVAAALFQAMPAWLRFLESRGLIDAATNRKVVAELLPLHETLLGLWKEHAEDPLLYRQELAWPAST